LARKAAEPVRVAESRVTCEIAGIVCLTLGAVLLVAFCVGTSGTLTALLVGGLKTIFGVGALAFPLTMLVLGILLLVRQDAPIAPSPLTIALPLMVLASITLAHLHVPAETRFTPEELQDWGGAVGAALAAALTTCFGLTGAYMVVAGLTLAAIVIVTPKPTAELLLPAGLWVRGKLAQRRLARSVDADERRRRRVASEGSRKAEGNGAKERGRKSGAAPASDAPPELIPDTGPPTKKATSQELDPTIPMWLLPPEMQAALAQDAGDAASTKGKRKKDATPTEQVSLPLRMGRIEDSPKPKPFIMPPMRLLRDPPPYDTKAHAEEAAETIRLLEEALASYSVGAKVVSMERGPAVTRYEVQPDRGVRGAQVTKLADDLARALAAIDVRVEPHVPGKSVIGIEVPNRQRAMVTLKEVLDSDEARGDGRPLLFALGKDISGNCVVGDLSRMPHLLVAGATNSGKSVSLNGIILSLLMRCTPQDVRFMMIDPKRVELALYDDIPHLISPVVYDAKEAAGLLRQAIAEMELRYRMLAEAGVRNISEFNKRAEKLGEEKLFYLIIVVDELADLMMQAAAEFEYSICRIAQLARAVGLHLIVATQRPSVNVVTGTIKANIPSRVAFAVSSQTDSRVILDCVGAERLIGGGDMLYLPIDASKPRRIQGAYTHVDEINSVVEFLKRQGEPEFLMEPMDIEIDVKGTGGPEADDDIGGSDSDLLARIVQFVQSQKQISTSMLQRKFRIGYNRAARIVDELEQRGIVSPPDGAKPRTVMPSFVTTGVTDDVGVTCE